MPFHLGASFYLILICLGLGFALRRFHIWPTGSHKILNVLVVYCALPAMVLIEIPQILRSNQGSALWMPAAMPWLFFITTWVVVATFGKVFRWDRHTTGALILTSGLCNTSFVGFPLLEAFYGKEALKTGLVIDQAGSFLVLTCLGTLAATYYAGQKRDLKSMIHRMVTFPPFLALLVSLLMVLFDLHWDLGPLLGRLSDLVIPVALISVGCQLQWDWPRLAKRWKLLSGGLIWKLGLGPALMVLIYSLVTDIHTPDMRITLTEAAMAPMITGAIVAMEQGLDGELASMMLGIGIPLSLFTVAGWVYILN